MIVLLWIAIAFFGIWIAGSTLACIVIVLTGRTNEGLWKLAFFWPLFILWGLMGGNVQ